MLASPVFYLAFLVLASGPVAGLFLLFEWFRHQRKCAFMLAWALGLFLLDWFQIPTTLFGARESFVYTEFNTLFAISVPLSFLGFLLIYLGIRAVNQPCGGARPQERIHVRIANCPAEVSWALQF